MANSPDQSSDSHANQPHDEAAQSTPPAGDSVAGSVESAEQLAEQSLDAVEKAADEIHHETADASAQAKSQPTSIDLPNFDKADLNGNGHAAGLGMLNDIDLQVKVELGRTRMYIEDVLKLNANSIVELDKAAGDPVDIYVNDRHVARGEVLVLSDNFCVRVSEIIKQGEDGD